ncbi:FAD-dependent oxidoreductase [Catellatospora bangladeshensis]|uniref:FAD-binding monooxygenase n=1 Tax=Catellatospora bangladeshensis TaxID=310355 RepID=A0A8J3JDR4_9ACTN|nr:squalene monooxygenase [Catellatospora bangladeshensis]GIF78818.1 FAD-binding monooxygenase [Catellatospora bangladeshensis]
MSAKEKSGHAIVLGASIGGLLAARVLSESFEKVTIFDRDALPTDGTTGRKGVPQGDHTHGLLARGRQVLEELFPGLAAELTAAGAVPVDVQGDVVWINDGHRLAAKHTGLAGLGVTRVGLEAGVRRRVAALPNVELRERHEALGLLASADRSRVTGARVLPAGGTEQHVDADLVIDATGRGNRGPTWLAELGYEKPAEEHVDPVTYYVSRTYRRTPGQVSATAFVISPSPELPYGSVAVPVEGDRWMITLIGVGRDNVPPADEAAYPEFARQLPGDELFQLVTKAEPIGPALKLRLPVSVRRRYERLDRLPEGLVAVADAICAFNPAYGQGMTVAAAEAMVLRDSLRQGREGLPKRFYAAAAKVIDVPWDIAVGADLRYPDVQGARTGKVNFLNAYVGRLHRAAVKSPAVGQAFLSVANLMAPPQRLFAPGVLARVLWHGRRTRPAPRPMTTANPLVQAEPAR